MASMMQPAGDIDGQSPPELGAGAFNAKPWYPMDPLKPTQKPQYHQRKATYTRKTNIHSQDCSRYSHLLSGTADFVATYCDVPDPRGTVSGSVGGWGGESGWVGWVGGVGGVGGAGCAGG